MLQCTTRDLARVVNSVVGESREHQAHCSWHRRQYGAHPVYDWDDMEPDLVLKPATKDLPLTLLQLLSNTLVLYQTAPYLPVSSLLALGAASRSFRTLIHDTPNIFRHLDLSHVSSAQFRIIAIDHGGEVWRNIQLDENVTEDECASNLFTSILLLIIK